MNGQKELVFEDYKKADTFNGFFFQQLGKNLSNLSLRGRSTLILFFFYRTPSIADLVL